MSLEEQPEEKDEEYLSWPVLIDLQEGFVDDTVTIRIGSEQVFHKDNVSTDFLEGRADSIEANVPEGAVTIEVSVISRQLSESIVLNVPPVSHLGIALLERELRFRVSDESFMYF